MHGKKKKHIVETLETYKDLFDNAHDLIHIVEPDGRIIYVNNAWETVLGYSEMEVEGKSIYSFIDVRDRDRFVEYRTRIIENSGSARGISVAMNTKAGDIVQVEGFVSAKIIEGQVVYTRGIFRDVTARVQNEQKLKDAVEQLREREANLQQLLHHAPDGVIVVDTNSLIRYWNPKAEVIFGWKVAEVLGRPLTQVIIPPQYREAHDEGMKRYLATGEERVLNRTIEITALNKEGREFYVALTISATLQNGDRAFIAFIRDIDEQKKNARELELRRHQLELSNQQLEQFAHVASHDMKEPIRKILLFSDRLQTDKENTLSGQSRNYLNKIQRSANRLAQMVDGVLAYSSLKAEELFFEKVDLNEIIRSIESDLEVVLEKSGAEITYSNLPSIDGASFLIYQLFYNLATNSLKFSKPDQKPVIAITSHSVPSEKIRQYGLNARLTYHEIIFRDNGIGFSQEHATAIFKTFSRLHSREKFDGTGLGLALCKSIVEKHGGIIKAYGEENVGASFHIILPEVHV